MSDIELLKLAERVRDAVWKGREADQLEPEEAALAMDVRELWQELATRALAE